jgi:DNA-directed RNA polymerase subunit RPC12/RpoP
MWRRWTLTKQHRHMRMWCDDCGHEVVHSPVYIAMFCELPYETTLWELAQRLHCKKCGSKRIGIEPTV